MPKLLRDWPKEGHSGFYKRHEGRFGAEYAHQHPDYRPLNVEVFRTGQREKNKDEWRAAVGNRYEDFYSLAEAKTAGVFLYVEEWARIPHAPPGKRTVNSRSKRNPMKSGNPHAKSVDNYSVRIQQTSGTWRNVNSELTLAEAKAETKRLSKKWVVAVFKGRKKHWSPKE